MQSEHYLKNKKINSCPQSLHKLKRVHSSYYYLNCCRNFNEKLDNEFANRAPSRPQHH
jgi:hypothetical protein